MIIPVGIEIGVLGPKILEKEVESISCVLSTAVKISQSNTAFENDYHQSVKMVMIYTFYPY